MITYVVQHRCKMGCDAHERGEYYDRVVKNDLTAAVEAFNTLTSAGPNSAYRLLEREVIRDDRVLREHGGVTTT